MARSEGGRFCRDFKELRRRAKSFGAFHPKVPLAEPLRKSPALFEVRLAPAAQPKRSLRKTYLPTADAESQQV
jgi:hypothetical protein